MTARSPTTEKLPAVLVPVTITDAVEELCSGPAGAEPIAGGTWVMRAAIRGEALGPMYVSLAKVPELQMLDVGPPLRIGACVTHARLAAALAGLAEFHGLRAAAERSANPAIRAVATVGGNLSAAAFPAADLVPALLALDAEVAVAGPDGIARMPVAEFLARREQLPAGTLVTTVTVARPPARSAHARLTLRSAGEYPVAIVSVAHDERDDGTRGGVRIAIGSVESVPRRWGELEAELAAPLHPAAAAEAAARLASTLDARDGVEAPGWYRTRVIPALVRCAVAELTRTRDESAFPDRRRSKDD